MLTTQKALTTSGGPRASVIILNWNGLKHLPGCLDSLQHQSFRNFEVILVDNGSTDGSVPFIKKTYPWVNLLCLPENEGFATGNNRGFEQARGNYIVTLNNDTRVAPDWLEKLIAVADQFPQAGMVGSRICHFDDPDLIDSLGIGICSDGMARGRYRNRRWSGLNLKPVDNILLPSACAALYKREMLDVTGFFDDDFFAYCEDVDLGLRGQLAGWPAVLATEAVVYHKYSQTGGTLSSFKVRLVERNHFWTVLKSFPLPYLCALPLTTLIRYFQQFRCVCCKQGTGAEFQSHQTPWILVKAALVGSIEALFGILRCFQKRRRIMKMRKISPREMSMLLRRYHLSFRELFDQTSQSESR